MTSSARLMAAGLPAGAAVQLGTDTSFGLVGTASTKATGVQLVAGANIIATCASAGVAAFLLPSSEASPPVIVENDGASSALVFANSTDTINALSAGASFSVTNAKRAIFWPVRKSATIQGWTAILSA
jgi:hypothetical protein